MGTIFANEHEGFNVRYHGNQRLNAAVPQSIKYEIEQFMEQNCFTGTSIPSLDRYVNKVLDFYTEHEFITNSSYSISYVESTWADIYKKWHNRLRARLTRNLIKLGLVSEHKGPSTWLERVLGLVSVYEVVPSVPVPESLRSYSSDQKELEVLDHSVEVKTVLPSPCRTTTCKISIKFNGCPAVMIICRACFTDPSI